VFSEQAIGGAKLSKVKSGGNGSFLRLALFIFSSSGDFWLPYSSPRRITSLYRSFNVTGRRHTGILSSQQQ
jgi:hypothetical protein